MPLFAATSSISSISPALDTIFIPKLLSFVFEINVVFEIADMLAKASPLNPMVYVVSKSSISLILLVACLSNAIGMSSLDMPFPLSETFINPFPPFFISIDTDVAPASIEFSTNSFTTFAGFSITSPAAILFIVKSSNITISLIIHFLLNLLPYLSYLLS